MSSGRKLRILASFALFCIFLTVGPAWAERKDPLEPRLPDIDAIAADLTSQLATLDSLTVRRSQRTLDLCRENFSMTYILREYAAGRLSRKDPLSAEISQDVWRYHECMAFVENDPQRCADLAALNAEEGDRVELCRGYYIKMVVGQKAISGQPDAAQACVSLSRGTEPGHVLRQGAIQQICADAVSGQDPAAVCARRSTFFTPPFNDALMKECIFWQSARSGKRDYCGLLPDRTDRCLEFASYRDAYEARNPALCGGSPACLAMMNGGMRSCDGLVNRVGAAYCRGHAQAAMIRWRQMLEARAEEASRLLTRMRALIASGEAGEPLSRFKLERARAASERLAKRLEAARARIETIVP